ncbi:hypothetical protein GK047_07210 [Paenibacillus sp. SYP-B3998]|uniref:DUF1304 domain-containing protein n=1 Tax=Paenibacillus sp. SYP-B3998 TaxID=2678564 RepID=A0A6G3ZUB3_9BACL|nr:DUF6463 family protein [Paenibacillus sp. SYP-B3998]NEW05806.1 hypothetical protein [Paenibacillus sp. SYP-B3998]
MVAAWILLALGIGHIIYGLIWFKVPFKEAFCEGFINKFKSNESRRSAFWFTIFGPLLTMSGHIAIYAANMSDMGLFSIIGYYLFIISFFGVLALPKSPLWVALILSLIFIAIGYGWIK